MAKISYATLQCDSFGEEGTIRFSERFRTEEDIFLLDFIDDWIELLEAEQERIKAKIAKESGPAAPTVFAMLGHDVPKE